MLVSSNGVASRRVAVDLFDVMTMNQEGGHEFLRGSSTKKDPLKKFPCNRIFFPLGRRKKNKTREKIIRSEICSMHVANRELPLLTL